MPISDPTGTDDQQGSRWSRSGPRNWRLPPMLLLFVAVPTAAVVALGGARVVSSWQSAVADQRFEALASLSAKAGQLAFRIEAERDTIVWYVAAGPDGRAGQLARHPDAVSKVASDGLLQVVRQQERYADSWVKPVEAGAAAIGTGYSRGVQGGAQAVVADLRSLPSLRRQVLSTHVPVTTVIAYYDSLVNTLLAFDDQVVPSTTDPQLTSTARSMATIARQEDELAMQRGIVMYGLSAHYLSPAMLGLLTASMADRRADLADFEDFATTSQITMFSGFLAASLEDRVMSDEQIVVSNTHRLASLPIVPTEWFGAISSAIAATHRFEETLANSDVERARVLRERAIISAIVIGGIILLVLACSLLLMAFVGRSMADRPRRLNPGKRWRQPRRGDLGADVAGAS